MAARWSRPALPLLLLLLVAVAVAPLLPFVCARPFDPSAPPPNPNPPSPAVVAERNARRFPGEWLPPGYDVGEPATSGTASSTTLWQSPSGKRAAAEPRVWFDHPRGTPRTPGRLLLNMLVRNEAENLARTLPKWAKITDYWIIGVDEKNDDDSINIIKRTLGHLPGEIALVKGFDGHGPTWTTLVEIGIKHYPGATVPAQSARTPPAQLDTQHSVQVLAARRPCLDKWELDIRCSKHMFTIWTEDHRNERKMDWVYRNIPGARITRRTHQVVEVPPLPDQEVFQTLLNLPLDERAGGYGDRSGNKQERYIAWMAADLLDFPDDPRALYYLGYGHLDLYNTHGGRPEARHIASLHKAVEYFTRRVDLPPAVGNKEERWFAMLKLAEIHERYLGQWDKAEAFYRRCIALDGERSDPYFYIGQHYRLIGSPAQAEADLYKAATLTAPVRSLFMWYHLYHCLSKLEYGRNHALRPSPTLQQCKRAIAVLDAADCSSGDPGNADEVRQLAQKARQQLQARREKRRMAKQRKAEAAEKAKLEEAEAAAAAAAAAAQSESAPETAAATSASGSAGRPLPDRLVRKPAAIVASDTKIATVRLALRVALERADELEQRARALVQQGEAAQQSAAADVHAELVASLAPMGDYLDAFTAIRGRKSRAVSRRAEFLSCRRLRMAAADYLRLVDLRREPIAASVARAQPQAARAMPSAVESH